MRHETIYWKASRKVSLPGNETGTCAPLTLGVAIDDIMPEVATVIFPLWKKKKKKKKRREQKGKFARF